MPGDLFDFTFPPDAPLRRAAFRTARPLLEWALRLDRFRRLYEGTRGRAGDFAQRALEALRIEIACSEADLLHLPMTGPLLVVSNHPHGAVDGLALLQLVSRRRRDVRLVANALLSCLPELRPSCFFVDPFEGRHAAAHSVAGLRAAGRWLHAGGTLIVFPAGEVARRLDHAGEPVESRWKTTAARLAEETRAQIVPALIEGRNRPLFYAAGRLHPFARTLLLPRETLALAGRRITVRFGALSSAAADRGAASPAAGGEAAVREAGSATSAAAVTQRLQRRVAALRPDTVGQEAAMGQEIDRLPAEALLLDSGDYRVFCAEARDIPQALLEIGRLREVTYRALGEGTGRDRDLDAFDPHYLHLFSWHTGRREVVGAYRIGLTDRLVRDGGVTRLYTRTLFRYDERFVARVSPALELGRSFVRAEYQRNHTALLLLWRGIGRFVVRNPHYRALFGAVSVSPQYSAMSQRLLMMFLEQNHRHSDLADLVQAVHAPDSSPAHRLIPRSVGMSGAREPNGRTPLPVAADGAAMPVLLRQYLKLDARVLGFSVDPAFGGTLDALVMVDLPLVNPAVLRRYFGAAEAAAYLAHHREPPSRAA